MGETIESMIQVLQTEVDFIKDKVKFNNLSLNGNLEQFKKLDKDEQEFYRETYTQIMKIINGESNERYFSNPLFFHKEREGWDEDRHRAFDVEANLRLMEELVKQEDILWLNILDKLYAYAPDDIRVQNYLQAINFDPHREWFCSNICN